MQASKNPGLHIYTNTGSSNPYLVFNLKSPTANHALSKLKVRQAIEYAINKVAIAKIYGGTKLNPILNGAIAPGNIGYTNYNYYPTPDNSGDPAKCKSMLAAAGYPHGFTHHRRLPQRRQPPGGVHLRAGQTSRRAASRARGARRSRVRTTRSSRTRATPASGTSPRPGWVPDWLGNNGRANVVPLFQTNCVNPTTNYGCYSSPTTDSDIKQALTAPSESAAAPLWAKAGQQVMKDAAIVPFTTQDVVLFASSKVHNLIYSPIAEQCNPTQLWLSH